jgi:hypothetical protein
LVNIDIVDVVGFGGFPASLVGGFERCLYRPDADRVEVETVRVSGFKGQDKEMLAGNSAEELFELGHGGILSG